MLASRATARAVHRSGEGWRETKNACLIRATWQTFEEDPRGEPPACFCDPKHVAKLAQTEALSVAAPAGNAHDQAEADEDEPLGSLGLGVVRELLTDSAMSFEL